MKVELRLLVPLLVRKKAFACYSVALLASYAIETK